MRKWHLLAFGIAVLLLANITAATDNSDPRIALEIAEAQAIQSALTHFGLDSTLKGQDYSKASVAKSVVQDEKFSFMEGNRKGDLVYCVELRDVKFAYAQDTTKRYIRDFKVNIDPKTGQLLSIYSVDEHAGSSDTLPEPPQAINSKMAQRILGLPTIKPKVSFVDALAACWLNPAEAKIVRAILVNYKTGKNKAGEDRVVPAWLVIMRGCEHPMIGSRPVIFDSTGKPINNEELPDNMSNNMICMVNANTGYVEFMETAPYIVPKN